MKKNQNQGAASKEMAQEEGISIFWLSMMNTLLPHYGLQLCFALTPLLAFHNCAAPLQIRRPRPMDRRVTHQAAVSMTRRVKLPLPNSTNLPATGSSDRAAD